MDWVKLLYFKFNSDAGMKARLIAFETLAACMGGESIQES